MTGLADGVVEFLPIMRVLTAPVTGVCWALAFVLLESVQFVFFGHIFQHVSTFLFGFAVFAITTLCFTGWAVFARRDELARALSNPRHLIAINLLAAMSWVALLLAVQLIEPAVAYTIGAGAMPLSAYIAYRFGAPEGEPMRNRAEAAGNALILVGLLFLAVMTIFGLSGFVRGGTLAAAMGVSLAFGEGVLFTWLLIWCQRLDRKGAGPAVVFGLRFPLYVVIAGGLALAGADAKAALGGFELAAIIAAGLLLIVPPLYALQRAVALISTLTLSALTALGPFVIFGLQVIEGRVGFSGPTLVGLGIYCIGAMLAAWGAVRAAANPA